MYTPHTVTVYNVVGEDPTTLMAEYNITILDGVFLDISKAANVLKSGLSSADSAILYIPFSIKAVNGVTGEPQEYVGPKEYDNMDDKSRYWTIQPGGATSAVDCFFVKGRVVEQSGFATINRTHDDVYRVNSVDTRDFGSAEMQHWQVGGQ